jgi:short-subunit dehydrogenase
MVPVRHRRGFQSIEAMSEPSDRANPSAADPPVEGAISRRAGGALRTTNKRALVVGNSDGIGLEFTRRLLQTGWDVTGVSRRAVNLDHEQYRHVVVDITSPEYRGELVKLCEAPFGLCVYCAGIGEAFDPTGLDADAATVHVNFLGMVQTAAAVVPAMVAAGQGHFIGLSSIGDGVSPDAPAYSASKAGVSSYLEGLALALRPHGVYVSNVRFGFVDTKMAKSPVKPMMISVDRACAVLAQVVRDRPAVSSYPKRMAALVWLVNLWTALRVKLA